MRFLKRKIVAAWFAVAAALGVQYHRPPVIEHRVEDQPVLVEPTPAPSPTAAPIGSAVPKMELRDLTGAYGTEIDMVKRSFVEGNDIMATPCFKTKVLGASFTETQGFDNQGVWNVLSAGVRKVNAEMYDGSWWENYVYKTMGYDVGDGTVYMNRFYADTTSIVRSLIVHEGEGHGNGFRHDGEHDTSVPYQLNDFIEDCAPAAGLK